MSRYGIAVKRGNAEYSISSDNKSFIASHVASVFEELKNIHDADFGDISAKLDLEKMDFIPEIKPQKIEQITENQEVALDLINADSQMQKNNLSKTSNNEISESQEPLNEDIAMQFVAQDIEPTNNSDIKSDENELSFENILEDKLKNPVFEEELPAEMDLDYESVIKMKETASLVDYLIITAYYMLENEGVQSFQLKQLNAKLFKSMKLLVDRKTMRKAIEDDFIKVVSDGADGGGIAEYALTEKGKELYLNVHS